jgi:ATP/maltotriose-dependent transcriptional regulator MalT
VGDKSELAITLLSLMILESRGDYTQAVTFAYESLALAQELDNKPGIAEALAFLSAIMLLQGDYTQATTLAQGSLALARELGGKSGIARGLGLLGEIELYKGNLSQAVLLLEKSLGLNRELGNHYNVALALNILGEIRRSQKDIAQAFKLYDESLSLGRKEESKQIISFNLIGFGKIAIEEGQSKRAAHLFGAAESWFDLSKAMLNPAEKVDYQRAMEKMHADLSDAVFLAAWSRGKTMTLEQVLAAQEQDFIIEPISSTTPASDVEKPATTPTYPDDLTPREVEVLRLLAQGWTDTQIAVHMVISPRTVNTHLTSIYRKIQVSSRSAATRYALEKKLI